LETNPTEAGTPASKGDNRTVYQKTKEVVGDLRRHICAAESKAGEQLTWKEENY